jgi:hypothetical protein
MADQSAACDECLARGHYCPGLVTADDGQTHLCFDCDAGELCKRTKVSAAPLPAADAPLAVPPASPVELAIEQHEERTAQTSLKAARLLSRGGKERKTMPSGMKLSVDTVGAIEAAIREKPGTELAIARRFGIGFATVAKIARRMSYPATAETLADQVDTVSIAHLSSEVADLPTAHQPKLSETVFDPQAGGRAGAFQAAIGELSRENELLEAQIVSNRTLIQQLAKAAGRRHPQPQQGA